MRLQITALALIVSSVLRSSSATGATLQLPSDVWENSTTQFDCTSDTVGYDVYNISEVRFWKESSSDLYFVYTKQCGTDVFDMANDTTNGRIALTSNNTVPTWVNLTSEDSGSYKCSLVSCSAPNEELVSDSVPFTVHKYNTAPLMLDPSYTGIGSNINSTYEVTITCAGFTGFPAGSLRLIEVRGYYLQDLTFNSTSTVFYSNATIDSLGNASFSIKVMLTFEKIDSNYFYCETYKKVGSVAVALQSDRFIVSHYFPPTLSYRLRNFIEEGDSYKYYYEENIDLYINDLGRFELTCIVSSNPVSQAKFQQLSEPNSESKAIALNTALILNVSKDKLAALRFQCTAEYKSPFQGSPNVHNGTVTVYLNYGEATTPSSGNAAESSGALLLIIIAVLWCFATVKKI